MEAKDGTWEHLAPPSVPVPSGGSENPKISKRGSAGEQKLGRFASVSEPLVESEF